MKAKEALYNGSAEIEKPFGHLGVKLLREHPHVSSNELFCVLTLCNLLAWQDGNGKLSSADEAIKHGEILETGNRQAMPQNTKEASFLTTTVPGDPTANADHHAP